jgi:hypothetical protein
MKKKPRSGAVSGEVKVSFDPAIIDDEAIDDAAKHESWAR